MQVFKTGGGLLKPEFDKTSIAETTPSVLTTTSPVYRAKFCEMLAPAMSESRSNKLRLVLQAKVDLTTTSHKRERSAKAYMDLYKWDHFFATDVIAELLFRQPFGGTRDWRGRSEKVVPGAGTYRLSYRVNISQTSRFQYHTTCSKRL
jgi:hypothetical protein